MHHHYHYHYHYHYRRRHRHPFFLFSFYIKTRKETNEGNAKPKKKRVLPRSLQENFFKETDSRRFPCRRRMGPFLHPVFIYLLFFFFFLFLSSPHRVTSPLVDPLPTHPHGSPRFFHGDEEIIGFLSLYIAPPSLLLLLPFPTGYSSIAFHRKAPKCSTLCVRYGDLFRQLERVSRFLCFSRCFSLLHHSLFLSFFLPLSFSLAHRRTATVIVKNRSCHADISYRRSRSFHRRRTV